MTMFRHLTELTGESVVRLDTYARSASIRQSSGASRRNAATLRWERYLHESGKIIGMKSFGASTAMKELQGKFGVEPERAAAAAKELLGRA